MEAKDFLDYIKKLPEERAIEIIKDMNREAERMTDKIKSLENRMRAIRQASANFTIDYDDNGNIVERKKSNTLNKG